MTEDVKVLNRKDSVPARTAPTGVEYKAFRLGEPYLWELFAVRRDDEGKEYPDKNRKQPIEGTFTSDARAYEALRRWLNLRWDESDEQTEKNKRKAA